MASPKKDYAAIAAAAIYRPGETDNPSSQRKPKILVYSRNKKGKSTFTATAPRILIADPEWGASQQKKTNPHVWPINRWSDMDDFYNFIRTNPDCPSCKEKHKFDWAGIDGMTRLSNFALKHVMKIEENRSLDRIPGLVQQRDYGKAGELMKDMMAQFHTLNLGVVYTAQERQDAPYSGDEDDDAEEAVVSYVADLPKGVRAAINSVVDVIGRLYVVMIDKDGVSTPQRRLWIGESMQYDTGYRSEHALPKMLKVPTVPRLDRLIRTGSANVPK